MECILHPTDFSPESHVALAHALRLAIHEHADLVILHVGAKRKTEHFPSVRKLLQRWGMVGPGATPSDVVELGIGIDKVEAFGPTIVGAIANFLDHEPADLLVMATHGRNIVSAMYDPSKAESTARRTDLPTLFVPANCRGFVLDDGTVSMKQVLVPIDHQPPGDSAVDFGMRLLNAFGDKSSKMTLLHIGDQSHFPYLKCKADDYGVERVCRDGGTVREILAESNQAESDVIVMTTEGKRGLLDALRGTTTEQILHQTTRPVLAVPAFA